MLRYALAALAAAVLVSASLIPDDAFARRAVAAAIEVEAITEAGPIYRAARCRSCRPLPRPWLCGGGTRLWISPGSAHGGPPRRLSRRRLRRGGAAAAAGAYGYYYGGYNNGCYQNSYGAWVCPRQYPY